MTSEATRGDRETMTTGQAAKTLGVSLREIRALCSLGELEFAWTRAHRVTEDVRGRVLRGHRRVYVDSVQAYAYRIAGLPGNSVAQNS